MVPTTVTVLDKFPLTANGKLDPSRATRARSRRTECTCRCEKRSRTTVLHVDRVGSRPRFRSALPTTSLQLGGDSIVAISLVTAARAAGLSISPREVFQLRTAEAMARAQSCRTTEIVDTTRTNRSAT